MEGKTTNMSALADKLTDWHCSTTGGAGGEVVTVSTLAEFAAAVNEKDATPRIVVVKGVISGDEKIRVGSHKTIIGSGTGSGKSFRSWNTGCGDGVD